MNNDLISRRALIEELKNFSMRITGSVNAMAFAIVDECKKSFEKMIEDTPTAHRQLKVFVIERKDECICHDVCRVVVVAKDKLHAERFARFRVNGFKKAKLEVKEIDLEAGEQILSIEIINN